jgi:Leucine-rich repeat (LRR) protein
LSSFSTVFSEYHSFKPANPGEGEKFRIVQRDSQKGEKPSYTIINSKYSGYTSSSMSLDEIFKASAESINEIEVQIKKSQTEGHRASLQDSSLLELNKLQKGLYALIGRMDRNVLSSQEGRISSLFETIKSKVGRDKQTTYEPHFQTSTEQLARVQRLIKQVATQQKRDKELFSDLKPLAEALNASSYLKCNPKLEVPVDEENPITLIRWFEENTEIFNKILFLDLSDKQFKTVPDFLEKCTNLREINLSGNKLDGTEANKLLDSSKYPLLSHLNLANNEIEALTDFSTSMSLLSLDLSGNRMGEEERMRIMDTVEEYKSLRAFSQVIYQAMGHKEVFMRFSSNSPFDQLSLQFEEILSYLESEGMLAEITSIDLSFRGLKLLPKELKRLPSLESLDLSGNSLEELPDWLGSFIQMRSLHLSKNQLRSFLPSLTNLTKLTTLDLSQNRIEDFTLPKETSIEKRLVKQARLYSSQVETLEKELHSHKSGLRSSQARVLDQIQRCNELVLASETKQDVAYFSIGKYSPSTATYESDLHEYLSLLNHIDQLVFGIEVLSQRMELEDPKEIQGLAALRKQVEGQESRIVEISQEIQALLNHESKHKEKILSKKLTEALSSPRKKLLKEITGFLTLSSNDKQDQLDSLLSKMEDKFETAPQLSMLLTNLTSHSVELDNVGHQLQELTRKRDQLAVRYDLDRFMKEANICEKMECIERLEAIEAKLKHQIPTLSKNLIEVLKKISTITPESQYSILERLNINEVLTGTQAFKLTFLKKQKLTKKQEKIEALLPKIQTNSLLCFPNLERFDVSGNFLSEENKAVLIEKIEEVNTRKRKGVSATALRSSSETLDQKIEDILKKSPKVYALFLTDLMSQKRGVTPLENEYEKMRLYQRHSEGFVVPPQPEEKKEERGCLDKVVMELEKKKENFPGLLKHYMDQKSKVIALLGKAVEFTT